MLRVIELIRRFAVLDTPVLVEGETGTGKELVARGLHRLSTRAGRPFIVADCASMPETLVESELFGHERGAFTGADRSYTGRVEAAAGGTLFLDEVNSLPLAAQAKLLRFLDSGEVTRIGRQTPVAVDVRIISAANVPLEELVAAGRMRADFFYRLNILKIEVPPLRDRLDDLPVLVDQFLTDDPVAQERSVAPLSDDLLARLRQLRWAGNVRELRNVLRRVVALGAEAGVLAQTPIDGPWAVASDPRTDDFPVGACFRAWMREREREYLHHLVENHPSMARQVAVSGLPERTLYRKLYALGLRGARRRGAGEDGPPP
jgi:transcriptional regulator with PAS, ATPase and Fis domain